jgi:flagellin-like hook-associated protein FlgL
MRSGQNDQFHRQWRFNSGAECTTYKENEMSSILTNNGAMVALQTLKSINSNMLQTQSEISTGKSISSARDNSALWAISKVMESDVKGFDAIAGSLALGESTVAVARNAAETVTDLLTDIKVKVVAAQESNVDRGKIQEDITALRGQIESVVGAAQFNGLNLVDGSSTDALEVLSSLDRGADGTVSARTIDVERSSLSLNGVASTVVFGGTAATGIATMGAATIAAGASNTFTIDQAYDGASYQIELGAIDLSVSGGGTSTGTRDFQFVASGSDSTESNSAPTLMPTLTRVTIQPLSLATRSPLQSVLGYQRLLKRQQHWKMAVQLVSLTLMDWQTLLPSMCRLTLVLRMRLLQSTR